MKKNREMGKVGGCPLLIGRVGSMLSMAIGYKNYFKFKLGTYAREALLESYVVCNSVL